jgi:sterol desaturase/sphingolipid hydroxylase (fatty acid hydroxylase superfamily)
MMLSVLIAGALGILGWTLTEYGMHRFMAHHGKPRGRFGREHLAHHAQPSTFTPTRVKIMLAIPIASGVFGGAFLAVGPMLGTAFSVGFLGAYFGYEVLHWSLHVFRPRTAYGRWARRHHLTHHFENTRSNHGVTSPLWDHVFDTFIPSQCVRIPPRFAPVWMCDEAGAVRPEYAAHFELRAGRVASSSRASTPELG